MELLTPFYIGILLLTLAIVLTFVRLLIGPSLPDRVIALDLLATVAIAGTAIFAMATNQPAFIDVATVLALISFLGTIAFAYYIDLRH